MLDLNKPQKQPKLLKNINKNKNKINFCAQKTRNT